MTAPFDPIVADRAHHPAAGSMQNSAAGRTHDPATPSRAYDCVVVGGGPAGATAALSLAEAGFSVALLDPDGRIKPCGGAVPPRLLAEFAIPDEILVARATGARVIAPSGRVALMPIHDGFVGMVDRSTYDEWLRARAASAGATRIRGAYRRMERDADGIVLLHAVDPKDGDRPIVLRARRVIGADGAKSLVARDEIPCAARMRFVFAYHEIVASPASLDAGSCEVHYKGTLSPDFYGWVFPHGETTSVGLGSAKKGFRLRPALDKLRADTGLAGARTVRREGAPIPMKPLRRWDNGRDVVLAGDAAGVVAPASGEGIYYAMLGGRLAADAVAASLRTGRVRALANARRRFMRAHGMVFLMLGLMQSTWYASDARRERFVAICRDEDVQDLTWKAYMTKELVRAKPIVHLRIFVKNCAHLVGLSATR